MCMYIAHRMWTWLIPRITLWSKTKDRIWKSKHYEDQSYMCLVCGCVFNCNIKSQISEGLQWRAAEHDHSLVLLWCVAAILILNWWLHVTWVPAMKLKEPFRGYRFPTLNDLNLAMTLRIRELNSNGLLDGVKKLPNHWKCVIEAKEDYIEWRNVKIDLNLIDFWQCLHYFRNKPRIIIYWNKKLDSF